MSRTLFGIIAALILFHAWALWAQKPDLFRDLPRPVSSIIKEYTLYNVNNMTGWVSYDGAIGPDPLGNQGIIYPRGVAQVGYAEGILWGTTVNDSAMSIRIGGIKYQSALAPGRLLPGGIPQDPNDSRVRVYRIRRDWETMSYDELRRDAAELFLTTPEEVSEEQVEQVRQQYEQDWNEWPGEWGAPYYDRNGNGVYDAGTDEPGLLNADQVIWLVGNDIGATENYGVNIFGSKPVGLELQITIWAYRNTIFPFRQATFRRFLLINKGNYFMDSTYLGIWSDPDVGYLGDDFVGCDTTLSLAYAYNAFNIDDEYWKHGLPPAAMGYVLLQGPRIVSPSDSAYWQFHRIAGFKNMSPTSFVYLWSINIPGPPLLYNYKLSILIYHSLLGYRPSYDWNEWEPYRVGSGPHRGEPTFFPLSGDPLTGSGDLDGMGDNFPPGLDRQMMLSTGPFAIQPGDSQEVIVAVVGGIDSTGDRLGSLAQLKENVRSIRKNFRRSHLLPSVSIRAEVADARHYRIEGRTRFAPNTTIESCRMIFSAVEGSEPDFELPLFDDGMHGDDEAGDNLWANQTIVENRQYPVMGDFVVYQNGQSMKFPRIKNFISLRPVPKVENFRIVWENGKQDEKINPGERVHFVVDVVNTDPVNPIESCRVEYYENKETGYTVELGRVEAGERASIPQAFPLNAPPVGDSVTLNLFVHFDHRSIVRSITVPIVAWKPHTVQGDTLAVEKEIGRVTNVIPIVADPQQLTGHRYAITFTGSTDTLHWRLWDLDTGKRLLDDQPTLSSPEQDGVILHGIHWKVFDQPSGLVAAVQVSNRNGPLPPQDWDGIGAPWQGNSVWRNLSSPDDLNRFYLSAMNQEMDLNDLIVRNDFLYNNDLELRFTTSGSIFCWWNEDSSWALVPFEAWLVGPGTYQDPSDDVRLLTGGFSGSGATADSGFTFKNTDPSFGFPATDWIELRVPLNEQGSYQVFAQDVTSGNPTFNWWAHSDSLLRGLGICDFGGAGTLPETGTVIRFVSTKHNAPGDSLVVQAPPAQMDSLYGLATVFDLEQNFPNPFNSITQFWISVPKWERIRLEVYDVLGRRVCTLLNREMLPGRYRLSWDGRDDSGKLIATGMYFLLLSNGVQQRVQKILFIR